MCLTVELIDGKKVLELGSGTGLAAFAIACAFAPTATHFTLTEVAGDPLNNLQHCYDVCTC